MGDDVTGWLLEADPAIRWQVLQDLLDAPADLVSAERARVATSGWGAELLGRQDPDGRWAGGLYNPKWTSTTYTLLLLHWLGLPSGHPAAARGTRALWDGAQTVDGGRTFSSRRATEPEVCITAMLVLLAAAHGGVEPERVDPVADWLLEVQLSDGGWNCASARTGSTHGSFHTSISVLDALTARRDAAGAGRDERIDRAIARGEGFLLVHRLYRSHRTGAVAAAPLTRFPFPPQWHHDVLRGLEHFRAAGASRDVRLADAIDVVARRRGPDGRWAGYRPYPGRTWIEMEPPGPSRWATLRALRVLRWWAGGDP